MGRFIFTGGLRALLGIQQGDPYQSSCVDFFYSGCQRTDNDSSGRRALLSSSFYKELRDTVCDAANNYVVQLNRNIKSQRSIHVVVGGDYSFRALDRPFKFTAELYYKKLDHLIPYEVDNLRVWYSGQNEAKGYAAGLI